MTTMGTTGVRAAAADMMNSQTGAVAVMTVGVVYLMYLSSRLRKV